MMAVALWVLLALQDEPLDRLLEKLGSTSIEERDAAEAEVRRRGLAAMDALLEAEKAAATPEARARVRRVIERIVGGRAIAIEELRAARVTIEKGRRTLRELAGALEKLAKIRIVVDGGKPDAPALPEMGFADATVEAVLDWGARQAGGFWVASGDRIVVLLPTFLPLRLYDVVDLSYGVQDDPELALGVRRPPPPAPRDAVSSFTGDDIAHLIKTTVAPDSWEEADGKSIQFQNGLLIVRNEAAVQVEIEDYIAKLRGRHLPQVSVQLDAYAVEPSLAVTEETLADLRRRAAEGKSVKLVASLRRATRDKRRTAFASVTRMVVVTALDAQGRPRAEEVEPGVKANVRASLSDDRQRARVELEIGLSRLVSLEKRKAGDQEIQQAEFAEHALRATEMVPVGKFVVLGRLGGTRLDDRLTDVVVIGRVAEVK